MNTLNGYKFNNSMLDTVTIKIRYPDFKVTEPSFFSPPLRIEQSYSSAFNFGSKPFVKYIQNPLVKDGQQSDYKRPRLTAYQRFRDRKVIYELHAEFSVPKLLFGNSLQELDDADFDKVVARLKFCLQRMGVDVTEEAVRRAVVTKAHFGKNIPLPHPTTAQDAIAELYKADLGKRKDVNIRHYENGGQALYFYATSANIIFYDKMKDIEATKNRAVDKNKISYEKTLFRNNKREIKREILRFEVRLVKQVSFYSFLRKHVFKKKIDSISFEEVFNNELCKKVLLASWEEITNSPANQLALKMDTSADEVFDAIIKNLDDNKRKKAHSLTKALASYGLSQLIKQSGVRKVRNKIEKNWSIKSWYRLSGNIKESATNLREISVVHTIGEIQLALEKFEKYDWDIY
tara:strand:+ start:112 stop:1323 length:1212 start_codon:yes stop_codon:yes gene_type:complete